jgi:hypothetical protein
MLNTMYLKRITVEQLFIISIQEFILGIYFSKVKLSYILFSKLNISQKNIYICIFIEKGNIYWVPKGYASFYVFYILTEQKHINK